MSDKNFAAFQNALGILGGHLYNLAADINQNPNDGSPRPTKYNLWLGLNSRVIVEIRPHLGPHSSWAPVNDEDAKCPEITVVTPFPSVLGTPNIWDHVNIYTSAADGNDNWKRGENLYSGNRVGACTFYAKYAANVLKQILEIGE